MINKTIIYIIMCTMAASLMSSCGSGENKSLDLDSKVSYMPIQTEPQGRWGMMSANGEILFANEFKDRPSLTINNVFSVEEDGGISLYTTGMQPRLIGTCSDLTDAGFCNDGRIPIVRKNSRITVVDAHGENEFALGPIEDKEVISCSKYFNDGLLVFADDAGKYGCYDVDGKLKLAPHYDYISDYNEGYAIAKSPKYGDKYIVMDTEGALVCELRPGFSIVSSYIKDGSFVVSDSANILCFANINGDISRLPAKVKAVGEYTDDLFTFKAENGYWGLMSRKAGNDMLMRPKFNSLTILPSAKEFLVDLDGRWAVIDLNGRSVLDFADGIKDVKRINYDGNVRYIAQDNAGWIMYNAQGMEVKRPFNLYGIGLNAWTGDAKLTSRVFDPKQFVDRILASVTLNSLNGILLNAISNSYYEGLNPEDYVDSSEFQPTEQPDGGFGYELSLVVVTDKPLTTRAYDQSTNDFKTAFKPNNTVYAIELIVSSKHKNLFSQTVQSLAKGLESKGFKLIDEDDDGVVTLQSMFANIEIGPLDGEPGISILMYRL